MVFITNSSAATLKLPYCKKIHSIHQETRQCSVFDTGYSSNGCVVKFDVE